MLISKELNYLYSGYAGKRKSSEMSCNLKSIRDSDFSRSHDGDDAVYGTLFPLYYLKVPVRRFPLFII